MKFSRYVIVFTVYIFPVCLSLFACYRPSQLTLVFPHLNPDASDTDTGERESSPRLH